MEEKAFDDWLQFKSEFIQFLPKVEPAKPIISNFLFRGQKSENWGIVSSFDRRARTPQSVSGKLLEQQRFYEYLMQFIGIGHTGANDFETAARAQHYGIPTRLIDWTQSPYVAAFFAFFDALLDSELDRNSRVAIYVLHIPSLISHPVAADQFKLHNAPIASNLRQRNQRGRFIEAIGQSNDILDFAQKNPDFFEALAKWTIPVSEAQAVLEDLILMGISPVDLYPDFEGVANYFKLREKLDQL